MRILVSGATRTVRRLSSSLIGRRHLGCLVTPQCGNSWRSQFCGLPWAADNAAYSNPDDTKFWNMCVNMWGADEDWLRYYPPAWVAVPDAVGNHSATLDLFESWISEWHYEIGEIPFPLAFVLQNGATIRSVPWDQVVAVFVGGDTDFKLRQSAHLIDEAKTRGKAVHVGRVNSMRRLRYAFDLGADSVDGSGFSRFSETHLPKALQFVSHIAKSPRLFR